MNKLKSHIQTGDQFIKIVGDIGSGKTRLVCETLKELGVRFVFTAPIISIIEQVSKAFDIPIKNEPFSRYEQVCCTYDSIKHALLNNIPLDHFDVFVFDEFHKYVDDDYWRSFGDFIEQLIERYPDKIYIFITATGTTIDKEYWYKAVEVHLEGKCKQRIDVIYVAHFSSRISALEWLIEHRCDIIYCDSIFAYYDSCLFDFGYRLLCSYNVNQINELIKDCYLQCKLYTTSVIDCGVNILNEGKLKVGMVVDFKHINHIKQFLGRFRNAELEIYLAFTENVRIKAYSDTNAMLSVMANCKLKNETLEQLKVLGEVIIVPINDESVYFKRYRIRRPKKVFWKPNEIPTKYRKDELLFEKVKSQGRVYYAYIRRSLVGSVLDLKEVPLSKRAVQIYLNNRGYIYHIVGDYVFIIRELELDQVEITTNMILTYCRTFRVSVEEALSHKPFKELLRLMCIYFGNTIVDEALKQFKCRRG